MRRLKGGLSTEQPLAADEIEALQLYLATRSDKQAWLFLSSQGGGRMTRQNFHYLVGQAGERADLGARSSASAETPAAATYSNNKGADTRLVQDWLGHRDIRHTARYTRTGIRALPRALVKPLGGPCRQPQKTGRAPSIEVAETTSLSGPISRLPTGQGSTYESIQKHNEFCDGYLKLYQQYIHTRSS